MELSIVTSSYNYGQYLGDWARSIIACDRKPAKVIIVDNASDDGHSERETEEAFALLVGAGIPAQYHLIGVKGEDQDGQRVDLGTARNKAVSLADTEWVMHLDADDMLMPHALADIEELMPDADVIAAGYERCGDLAAGPRNRTRLYSSTQGKQTLDAVAPASGVSPFRRRLWEQSPYRTDMRGGWDTALWIGFAKLNARFRATKRPVFWYRQHSDSIFNTRRVNARASELTGRKLQSLRAGHSGVSIIVPWQSDNGPRAKAWAYIKKWYAEHLPDWELIEASSSDKPWRKGAVIMNALHGARGETLVIADADCIVDADGLREAVELVQTGKAPWVVPHTLVKRLSERSTEQFIAKDFVIEPELIRTPYEGFAGGGIVVVGRAEYEATGGIPVGFQGWGAEDETLALLLDALLGPHVRLEHDLWHLWHEPGPRGKHEAYRANRRLHAQYAALADDPDALWAFTQGANFSALAAAPRDAGRRRRNPEEIRREAETTRQMSRLSTLAIREQQRLRNAEANAARAQQESIEDRRLALAGRKAREKGRHE